MRTRPESRRTATSVFGRLTLSDFLHAGPVETGAQLVVLLAGAAIVLSLLYKRRYVWLWKEWLTSLDHKKIGVMYLALSGVMLLRGFIDALMMRSQQAVSAAGAGYLSPDHYAQVFTAHGVIMIFFAAMPFMFGLINIVLPLQIGARDVAFPLLNAVSFWLTAAGAMLVNCSLVIGSFAATGWLAYPPLSELQWSPGVGVDYYLWALQIAGAGTLLSGINFIATIATMRAPGMKLMRMPLFTWTTLNSMLLVVFAFPILTVTLALLALDRLIGAHFFTTDLGGNAMLYVNLIWAWGHPEVYILILPAFGIFSEVVATFSQKRLFGYTSMVVATCLISALSFMVWVHHFFTMGAGANVNAFFGIMTMVIAIPTGVKVFNWLFTMFRGRIIFKTPMLWFMGFVATFVLGGMTGVLMSIPGIDFELHNSVFLVAHFHNMIIGGVLFGFFAGFTYWFPKIFGFTLDERLGRWAFWNWLVGFLMAFMPLYALGLMGMTRRLDTIRDLAWEPLLVTAGIGACIIGIGALFQVAQLVVSIRTRGRRKAHADDPWDGRTLEWATSSPPPAYNFAALPLVRGRDALWTSKRDRTPLSGERPRHVELPLPSAMGPLVGAFSFAVGFGIIWHIWWLAGLGFAAIVTAFIARSFAHELEEKIPL